MKANNIQLLIADVEALSSQKVQQNNPNLN